MAGHDISQELADALIQMRKVKCTDTTLHYPIKTRTEIIPLQSEDGREQFFLDIHQGQINLKQTTLQNRGRQVIILVRLDLHGPPHKNPDGVIVPCPHLHRYREGYADKWAEPAPEERFSNLADPWTTFLQFLAYCNVVDSNAFTRSLLP